MTLSQILNDPEVLEKYHGAYSDGWGGVLWLTGLCPNGWYVHTSPDGENDTEYERRKNKLHSNSDILKLAKEQLERFAWFGLLDQADKSMDMLKWQMDLDPSTPGLASFNRNSHSMTEEDLQQLQTLLPLD